MDLKLSMNGIFGLPNTYAVRLEGTAATVVEG